MELRQGEVDSSNATHLHQIGEAVRRITQHPIFEGIADEEHEDGQRQG